MSLGKSINIGFLTIIFAVLATVFVALYIYSVPPNINDEQQLGPRNEINGHTPKPKSWNTVTSSKYKYRISYPPSYSTQGIDKQPAGAELSEYSEISIGSYDERTRISRLNLKIWPNPTNISPKDWYTSEINRQEKEKLECQKNTPGTSCPNLTLKNITQKQESTTFKNLPAYKTLMFRFDHSDECWLITKYLHFYQICFDVDNPNDPELNKHLPIYKQILESFDFLK